MLQGVCEREEGTKTRSTRKGEPKGRKMSWMGYNLTKRK